MTALVPIVDLAAPPDVAAAAIDDACRRVGFFQVTGHGIADDLVDGLLDSASRFFGLPEERKQACVPPEAAVDRGWAPIGSESLAYSLGVDAPPDLFEAFNVGHEFDDTNPFHRAHRDGFFAPNIWPDVDGFRDAFVAYFGAAGALSHRLTGLMARALELPPDFFVGKTDHSADVLRVNWYRRAPGSPPPRPGQQRMGAHTDYGVLTVLLADRVAGLEIVAADGEWVGVMPEPGCLLVNLGDLLAQWTNDRWLSTLHRVVPPGEDTDRGECLRRSAAFFHEANADALVEVLETCVSAERPARYEPVPAGDHLLAKLLGPRELRRSDAVSTVGERTVRVD